MLQCVLQVHNDEVRLLAVYIRLLVHVLIDLKKEVILQREILHNWLTGERGQNVHHKCMEINNWLHFSPPTPLNTVGLPISKLKLRLYVFIL